MGPIPSAGRAPISALRLFGFEQRAPVALRLRLTAVREPGQSPALLTVGGIDQLPSAVIQPLVWRRYSFILPAPERGDESPLLTLHTSAMVFANESRDLGVVLSSVDAIQYPLAPAQHLPDAGRLAFLVLLGLLIHAALRRFGLAASGALLVTAILAGALGIGIALAPGQVAYWLPNMWFACAAGWVALGIAPLLRLLQLPSMPVKARVPLGLCALAGCPSAAAAGPALVERGWLGNAAGRRYAAGRGAARV